MRDESSSDVFTKEDMFDVGFPKHANSVIFDRGTCEIVRNIYHTALPLFIHLYSAKQHEHPHVGSSNHPQSCYDPRSHYHAALPASKQLEAVGEMIQLSHQHVNATIFFRMSSTFSALSSICFQ